LVKILVIEDDPDIADFVRRGLIYKDYEVEVAQDGQQGLDVARDRPPDLVLLDLMIPKIDGVEVCRRLRAGSDMPIIILTARDSVSDKISGLDAGADDYVTKPFAFDELLARVRAALRRKEPGEEVITVGDLTIRPASREVKRGQRDIQLTQREFDLLLFLARNAGKVVDRNTIFENVWGYTFDVESDTIKVYVRYLRRKLNVEGEPDLIHAIRGIGYMLKV
jgi:Response regulators consisting of a CheY-like receiver domain and a winged-helix DNA-binding domain